ncbi:TIR domain-containing protein [Clostridium estertheticum]|uniref:TIR domain-containing protein n=1 Tax=Clostridium estertheticum TaxID=238834 RepID=UPI001CF2173D|nr:TIR domain-containing protein [Clostridium estertheticum]MCB2352663.1 TIR domain-containing protein [Clostridium estertheticum]WAG39974.1 TIR domain-containing protein [Clostridium estertheticum]
MSNRVFFSFHYKDVIDFRANVVRKHNIVKGKSSGYFDASIWEDAKKESNLALKRLINRELENTSVTAVLIGSDTYNRQWVKYEILRSMWRGNNIIGIHINSIPDKNGETKINGNNPFDYLGIRYNQDGTRLSIYEWMDGKWVEYSNFDNYNIKQKSKEFYGKFYQLSKFYNVYDWIGNDGYNNFVKWIE